MTTPLAPDFRPQYHQLHRVGRPGIWRSLVGSVLVLVLVFLLVPAVAGAIAFAALMAAGNTMEETTALLDVTAEATPVSNVRASREYRQEMLLVLSRRALVTARRRLEETSRAG